MKIQLITIKTKGTTKILINIEKIINVLISINLTTLKVKKLKLKDNY